MTAAPDYGRAFALWRDAAGPAWGNYTRHGFVEALRTGSLPRARFLDYLRQDYVFLIHFSRAWALAAAKAETLAEMQAAADTLQALVQVEMPLHLEVCGAAGLSAAEVEATPEAPANLAYTRYVLEAGYSGDFLDLMAALAPCVMGYGTIGARLAGAGGPYSRWIETYAGEAYQSLCRDMGNLVDQALDDRLGTDWAAVPRFARLTERFATATRLEVGFFDLGLSG